MTEKTIKQKWMDWLKFVGLESAGALIIGILIWIVAKEGILWIHKSYWAAGIIGAGIGTSWAGIKDRILNIKV